MSGRTRRFRRRGRSATPISPRAEAGLPVLTYQQVFQDPRLQTLVAQALANNRDLMVAASNIAAAREQYRIQRAQQLPQVDAGAGATRQRRQGRTGVERQLQCRRSSVPSFELDLFGRVRSLTHVQLQRYLATEAARARPG